MTLGRKNKFSFAFIFTFLCTSHVFFWTARHKWPTIDITWALPTREKSTSTSENWNFVEVDDFTRHRTDSSQYPMFLRTARHVRPAIDIVWPLPTTEKSNSTYGNWNLVEVDGSTRHSRYSNQYPVFWWLPNRMTHYRCCLAAANNGKIYIDAGEPELYGSRPILDIREQFKRLVTCFQSCQTTAYRHYTTTAEYYVGFRN